MDVAFEAELWLYPGKAGWHFVTLPQAIGQQVKFYQGQTRAGFGSVPVIATIGKTAWATSLFPDAKSGSYLLPVKADVRRKEKLASGTSVSVTLTLEIH